ncbi:Aste57867_10308 [Aphanomyces stellatus]|uniref:Aste57867_10308 protein n=1 Tax=Aphanomyces stellatus TaxID=120398 RepID=A0A485KQJ6_9STRA|nr:hypothetical protein As57867_010268 [Aphanomyces stellatus]VFT87182.1 Aste57867_10308 [Aphanomyces stellatus]
MPPPEEMPRDDNPSLQQAMQCRYKTGRCPYPRAVKSNGVVLRMCEFHRHRQNSIKHRSDLRHRERRTSVRGAPNDSVHPIDGAQRHGGAASSTVSSDDVASLSLEDDNQVEEDAKRTADEDAVALRYFLD